MGEGGGTVRSESALNLALGVRRVPFAVVTLHFFGRSPVAVTVEVDCHKRDPGGNESVAFSENGIFGGRLVWGSRCFVAFKSVSMCALSMV